MTERELLLERLERLAIVLDEIMPRCAELVRDAIDLLKEQEAVVHCGDCENFCFDNISPNAGRCILTNKSHSRTWFCAHGKREDK